MKKKLEHLTGNVIHILSTITISQCTVTIFLQCLICSVLRLVASGWTPLLRQVLLGPSGGAPGVT